MVLGFIFQRGGGGDKQVQRSKGRERGGGLAILPCGWEKKVKYVLITLLWISHIFFSASIHRKSIIPHVNFNYHDVLKKLGIVSNLIIFEKCTQMMNFFLALSTIKISVYLYTSKYIFSWYVINWFLLVLTDKWCILSCTLQETFLVLL